MADYGVFESSVCNSVTDLVPGKEYSIDGVDDYIYQGKTGDAYIFNTSDKENPTPVEMNLKQISEIISKGKIQCLK